MVQLHHMVQWLSMLLITLVNRGSSPPSSLAALPPVTPFWGYPFLRSYYQPGSFRLNVLQLFAWGWIAPIWGMGSPDFAQKVKEGNHVRISVLLAQNLTKFLQQFYWRWPQQKPPLFWLLPTSSFLSARSLVPIQWTLWSALQTSLLLWLLTSHQCWRDKQKIYPHETPAHLSQREALFPNFEGRVKEGIS